MERKLASIQVIHEILPIEGADAIEKARVLGWSVVVRKGEFKVDDLCVYCEIDSVLPDKPEFAFLKDRAFRIKTIKLKKQISQGICFPLSILPQGEYLKGMDVTGLVGITQYEIPLPAQLQGKVIGNFPSFLIKTDEIRLQSAPNLINEMKNIELYVTMKCDGTSFTCFNNEGRLGVCSRRMQYKEDDTNTYSTIYRKLNLDKITPEGYAIQGEVCGPGIQANRMQLKETKLFVFNVFDIKKHRYLDYNDFIKFVKDLGLETVPIIYEYFLLDLHMSNDGILNTLLAMAEGNYPNTTNPREGIVIRPKVEKYSPELEDRLSCKVINNSFLLKFGE